MTEHADCLALECLLKEADLLQSEMDKRLERHHQSFYLCMIVIAAAIGGYATSLGDFHKENHFLLVLGFFPCLTTPLAAMFFDDEMMRAITDLYIHDRLASRIRELLKSVGYGHAEDAFSPTLTSRFAHIKMLNEKGRIKIRVRIRAGTIRRFLFAIPFVIAVSALSALGYRAYLSTVDHFPFDHVSTFVYTAWVAFGVDVGLFVCLCIMWKHAAHAWTLVSSGEGAERETVSQSSIQQGTKSRFLLRRIRNVRS